MFLRANSTLAKPNATLVGVLHRPSGPRRSTTPRFCSSSGNMDSRQQTPYESSGDVMSDSFGEGYASRSVEEGFGGIYQQLNEDRKEMVENSPESDKSQGSEVKENEKEPGQGWRIQID